MLDSLKSLFENSALSEEVRSELEEAWNAKVEENKLQATAELREEFAKKYAHDKTTMVEAIDAMLSEKLAEEIAEFHEDKKDLAETKVRLIREAKKHLNTVKEKFVKNGAKVVENTVAKTRTKEIGQLKEDIDVARKNDFGRKLFETFAEEYTNSYLNEKSETAKLLKVVDVKDKAVAEAKAEVEEVKKIVESKDAEINKISDAAKRKEVMHELTGPLSKDQREIMVDLLENVQTDGLRKAFDKYIPAVIDGKTPAKKKATLTESEAKEITGDKAQGNQISSGEKTAEIFDIRRLAGLKV